jgi:tetratricopeptide (TPR) repeat protein
MRPSSALALALTLIASAAAADPQGEAEKAMRQGGGLFERGKYAEAIKAYQRALSSMPEATGPYREIGKAYKKLGRSEEAIDSFSEYLARRPEAPEREEIEETFAELRGLMPREGRAALSVDSAPEGAVVFVVDAGGKRRGIGLTPISEHPVDPAAVEARIVWPGGERAAPLSLRAGEGAALSVVRPEGAAAEPPRALTLDTPSTPARSGRGGALLAIGAGAGAGAAAAAAAFWIERAAFRSLAPGDPTAAARQKRLTAEAAVADALLAAAVVTGGVGLVLKLRGRPDRPVDLTLAPGGLALRF